MTDDPYKVVDESLGFRKCGSDIECYQCEKLEWCGKMETNITMLINQIEFREKQMRNKAADERGDDYLPGKIVGCE